jgi:hypothetical protein
MPYGILNSLLGEKVSQDFSYIFESQNIQGIDSVDKVKFTPYKYSLIANGQNIIAIKLVIK